MAEAVSRRTDRATSTRPLREGQGTPPVPCPVEAIRGWFCTP